MIIFAGRFGSGKTEVAINFALSLVGRRRSEARGEELTEALTSSTYVQFPMANSRSPILIDLDIVTPYFRSREAAEALAKQGVQVISPSAIGRYLDTPAITPQILGAMQQAGRPVVLDVGGDKQGARALGQFSPAIRQREYVMHFVVNPYRPFTDSLEGLTSAIAEIEASSRLQVSCLVSNPNLINETTIEHIIAGHAKIEGFAREMGLPIAFVCVERRWVAELGSNHFAQPVLALDRYFVMSWE